ncbi:MAG TPA: FmdE family protein [Candidatus Binatia bacterium]|jgi:formylmethanofuran dehydrogenase subunit E
MRSFEELLKDHPRSTATIVLVKCLGVRMAMIARREVGIDEPKNCKKLIVYVEMDRCATDAFSGCDWLLTRKTNAQVS